jgi:hypothetical protein
MSHNPIGLRACTRIALLFYLILHLAILVCPFLCYNLTKLLSMGVGNSLRIDNYFSWVPEFSVTVLNIGPKCIHIQFWQISKSARFI